MLQKLLYNFYTVLNKSRLKYIVAFAITIIIIDQSGLHLHLFEVDYERFSYPLDVPMEDILIAMKSKKEPPYKPINRYDYTLFLENRRKCLKVDSDNYEKVVIFYVIKSSLNHQSRREVIRKTWGWEKRFSDVIIKRIFILGISNDETLQVKINEEYAVNKDIVQADFIDSYYNNTIKTIISFKWVIKNCPKAQFIVFSDDDMYISTKNMLKFIRNPFNRQVGFRKRRNTVSNNEKLSIHISNTQLYSKNISKDLTINFRKLLAFDPFLSAFDGRLFAGFVFNSSPIRYKSSKWYVTLNEYPFAKYPPYITAGAYVLSYPALEDMYYTSLFTKHFKFDDIYLGIIAKKCNIYPFHNEHFHFWKKIYSKEEYANVIASHGYDDPQTLNKVWEEQRTLGHA